MKASRRAALSGLIAVIITAVVAVSFRLPSPDELPRCLNSALIAFQSAQAPQEAAQIWAQLGQAQSNLGKGIYADFVFIAAYTFLFLVLAATARLRPIHLSRAAGGLAMVSAIVTAVADCCENFFTLRNISGLRHGILSGDQVAMMRYCSLTKWAAWGVTLMLLWWTFVPSRRGSALYRLLALTVGVFSFIAGSLGVLGLWDNPKFEMVIPFFGLSLLLQLPLFWWYWEDIVGKPEGVASQAVEKWEIDALPADPDTRMSS